MNEPMRRELVTRCPRCGGTWIAQFTLDRCQVETDWFGYPSVVTVEGSVSRADDLALGHDCDRKKKGR